MSEKCFECGRKANRKHHVVPKSLGGTKTILLCSSCHSLIHNKNLTAMTTLSKNVKWLNMRIDKRIRKKQSEFRIANECIFKQISHLSKLDEHIQLIKEQIKPIKEFIKKMMDTKEETEWREVLNHLYED